MDLKKHPKVLTMQARLDRNPLVEWWWTIDRTIFFLVVIFMISGIVLGLAGSPPVAERLGLPTFYFVTRQAMNLVPSILLMFFVSFLSPRAVRRTALIFFVVSLAFVVVALLYGVEVKGARRWITLLGITVQPSEFLKPSFVILAAWAFSEGGRRVDLPGNFLGFFLLFLTIIPIVMQPDIGQTMLISIVWGALVFLSGLHLFWVLGIGGIGMLGLATAYRFLPHVRDRIDKFQNPSGRDTFQVDNAISSFIEGGWFGKGPGEGTIKRILPDSHTDFVFAVTAEEFGIFACIVLLSLFAIFVLRGLILARRNSDPFCRLAAAGLVILFGIQASINMAVNVHLIPAKGMTLPFISYGGSSLISLGLAMGFLLAVTRRRPRADLVDRFTPEMEPQP
jgi:cell division protein FtsW